MMNVKIDDEDLADAQVLDGVPGGHGDVVEDAVAVELLVHGVVAGRADEGEAILQSAWN